MGLQTGTPLPTVLSLSEVAALLRAIRDPRYQAIAMVMYGTGLRISEALALEVRDPPCGPSRFDPQARARA